MKVTDVVKNVHSQVHRLERNPGSCDAFRQQEGLGIRCRVVRHQVTHRPADATTGQRCGMQLQSGCWRLSLPHNVVLQVRQGNLLLGRFDDLQQKHQVG